jgi:hypothetical protein
MQYTRLKKDVIWKKFRIQVWRTEDRKVGRKKGKGRT